MVVKLPEIDRLM